MSGTIIATNALALNAHRNLKGVGRKNAVASERLSSGLRINSGADDAAGIAISEKMKTQIRGLQQGDRNTQDGINLIKTMDGGMEGIQDMMKRQYELIVQALNDTNTDEDRAKIQVEIDQLNAEIGMMAERTTFNNIPLLSGASANTAAIAGVAANAALNAPISIEALNEPIAIEPFAAAPAPTQTINLSTLANGQSGTGWNFNNGVLTILNTPGTPGEILELTGTMAGSNRIVVDNGAKANIILNNARVNTSTGAALDMRGAEVNLWLEGSNSLRSNSRVNAGIETTNGTLTIDGSGSVTAYSDNKAGIGGGQVTAANDASGGTIIVNGGNVTAIGYYGVGIGGGDNEDGTGTSRPCGKGANLTINGGRVEATGGYATDKIAIGGGGSGDANGGDGGTVTVNGGILIANGNIGGGSSLNNNGSGKGADVKVTGGLLYVTTGWIGGGGNFSGTINGANGTTTVTNGNLSIADPGTNIKGGVKNSSVPTYAVQIFLYDPVNGQQFQFAPYTEFTYTLGSGTYKGITDEEGRLYMYMPTGSQGIQGTMTVGGKTYVGTLKTMNADHYDYLVFADNGVDPPDPPDTPWPPYPDQPGTGNPGTGNPGTGDPTGPPTQSNTPGDLWIQSGANSWQGMFISRYDCRPEALYKDVFDPNTITMIVNGVPEEITLTKLVTQPWVEATASLMALDTIYDKVNSYRAKAGAQQNRLEFSNSSTTVTYTNLEESNSRIADADMAKEMMAFSKSNVLQQAGTAMLAQARQSPESVLQLLR